MNAPLDEAAARLAAILTEEQATTLTVYDWHGGYGHPDHIAAGERALRAVDLAGIERYEPELGDHVHVKRVYRFVASADLIDNLQQLVPEFAEYIATLTVKPQRWTRERLGAVIDAHELIDRKIEAMRAHRTQAPDMKMWLRVKEARQSILSEEHFVREFPDPHGPLETDLFAALR